MPSVASTMQSARALPISKQARTQQTPIPSARFGERMRDKLSRRGYIARAQETERKSCGYCSEIGTFYGEARTRLVYISDEKWITNITTVLLSHFLSGNLHGTPDRSETVFRGASRFGGCQRATAEEECHHATQDSTRPGPRDAK
jgi:hypothetical protein